MIKPLSIGILIGAAIIYLIFVICEVSFSKSLKLHEKPTITNEPLQFLEPIGSGGNLYLYDNINGKVWLVTPEGTRLIPGPTCQK